MPDQKLEAKHSRILNVFRRKEAATTARNASSDGTQEPKKVPSPRRVYKPRYAERDMVLSMPVEQRPDLVAKASEARLQGVCSDIGFNTSSLPCSAFSHLGAGCRHLSIHPNIHLKLQGALNTLAAGSRASSFHDSVLQSTDVSQTSSSPALAYDQYIYAANAEVSSRALQTYRPGQRSYYPHAAVSQTHCTPIKVIDRAYAELGVSGANFEPERDLKNPGTNTWHAAYTDYTAMATHVTTRLQNSNYGHSNALPRLMGDKGRGRQDAQLCPATLSSAVGSQDDDEASNMDYLGDHESYVLRTMVSPTLPSGKSSALPGKSPKHTAYDLESSSSSFSESPRNVSDSWSGAGSERRDPSTSTLMTSYDESSDAGPSTALTYQLDAATLKNEVDFKPHRSGNSSDRGHEERADFEVEPDSDDEARGGRKGQLGELQADEIGTTQ
ncbi:hypothetical protein DOTSEDRAFT_68263 [Dothistroma septosporum NZE10]|uniref:Uncharacterized protein n=1 Tax=Dothistroma septosporum (strain NZE10 / CBS 128990) TaxID=675120 RepID=N1Q0Y9_DOTSN|nr:hypothetical protein DOTSEDRAFT_68263 [Dothistroma septosporum NZE10]